MPRTINIRNVDDLKIVEEAILNNEDFILGEVEAIKHVVKLDGGRFTNYDINYITSDVAKIILSHQKNFTKLLKEIESKFGVRFTDSERELKFQLQQGCLEIFSNVFSKEAILSMDSKHKMWTLITIAGLIVGSIGVSQYINHLNNEVQAKKEVEIQKLQNEARQSEVEATKKYFDGLIDINKNLVQNKTIQDSINNPKKETLEVLKDDEVYKTVNNQTLTRDDATRFEYVPPVIDDTEEEITDYFDIDKYYFRSPGKEFKINGITKELNSLPMPLNKRMQLITKAENQEQVQLKIKLVKDGVTNKIKEAYLLDYIEN
ncbi:hypothetical protein NG752_00645 [Aliarcobacter cryaerophilus]|uniref:hypothetical protein n=1 Tax=Aliarcobacter cryaerophilus TaxID=28198 RepID=UPI003DA1F0E1